MTTRNIDRLVCSIMCIQLWQWFCCAGSLWSAQHSPPSVKQVSGLIETAEITYCVLLLRILYNQVINKDDSCVITYTDYTTVFHSISLSSHKFMDRSLAVAGASRKNRSIFHTIYRVVTGIARVRGTDDTYAYTAVRMHINSPGWWFYGFLRFLLFL